MKYNLKASGQSLELDRGRRFEGFDFRFILPSQEHC